MLLNVLTLFASKIVVFVLECCHFDTSFMLFPCSAKLFVEELSVNTTCEDDKGPFKADRDLQCVNVSWCIDWRVCRSLVSMKNKKSYLIDNKPDSSLLCG